MHMRHKYTPNLIGALIGALLCFVLLETIPALMLRASQEIVDGRIAQLVAAVRA